MTEIPTDSERGFWLDVCDYAFPRPFAPTSQIRFADDTKLTLAELGDILGVQDVHEHLEAAIPTRVDR